MVTLTDAELQALEAAVNADPTGCIAIRHAEPVGSRKVWYDLSGRQLQQRPSAKGVYIVGSKKVSVK